MTTMIVWLRQDLRLSDNPALWHAAQAADDIIPVYILDENDDVGLGGAQRWWLHHSLHNLQQDLAQHQVQLLLQRGSASEIIPHLVETYQADGVYWNRCYEPQTIARDKQLKQVLTEQGIAVQSFNASLLQEPWTVLNKSGGYFKVFTPYWKHCLASLVPRKLYDLPKLNQRSKLRGDDLADWQLLPTKPDWSPGLQQSWHPGEAGAQARLDEFITQNLMRYADKRDFMDDQYTSRLSPHLHFGEIGPWQIWHALKTQGRAQVQTGKDKFFAEVGWREFSYYLLYHFPELPETNFREEFNRFPWRRAPKQLKAWQRGLTGYPIVDAGMRELWHTGYMHNRVRMITASFLTKHLLLDWRLGADWFWDTLVDADLASNSASWQWVAGCGADAAPYFRIFNPIIQGEKFDAQGAYVRQWVPELAALPDKYLHKPWEAPLDVLAEAQVTLGKTYPQAIVEHSEARARALAAYQQLKEA